MGKITIFILILSLSACGGSDDSTEQVIEQTPTTPDVPVTKPPASVCDNTTSEVNWDALMTEDCTSLSQYGLFVDPSVPTSDPVTPGMAYQLSTQLFSNYANKHRFIFLPQSKQISYHPTATFELPVGTVLVKTFSLPFDTQVGGANNEVQIETRLLIHREVGWTTLPYVWNGAEATLQQAGLDVPHSLNHQGVREVFDYHVPSRAECKICHQSTLGSDSQSALIRPIGIKAHLLNRDISYQGQSINQLRLWQQLNLLNGLPALSDVGITAEINDQSASLTSRAKGYLDINCAHCHNADGFASISGLRLGFYVDHTSYQYGICKQPPGWDGGSKGLSYDIIPGDGEHSILVYRQELNQAKDRMPPLGRAIVHTEAVAVIKEWIDAMPADIGHCQHL
ncbi:Conserved hypothetical protein [Shewanella piezotolerans WP3]|uniref:Repeat protein (TIGR03806 family) n=1 Tax=Shewanella piezotolerans (strain WP3 / JCM 13877) TaxID=225849 RepID=B8CLP2_SHEPW|nr:SO2930 family diheme c-type cytochrome [Shewanella piezotolerans]ACJ28693.1 Conserved hypothetical protein [Shewanella piezotolerans WP3]